MYSLLAMGSTVACTENYLRQMVKIYIEGKRDGKEKVKGKEEKKKGKKGKERNVLQRDKGLLPLE